MLRHRDGLASLDAFEVSRQMVTQVANADVRADDRG